MPTETRDTESMVPISRRRTELAIIGHAVMLSGWTALLLWFSLASHLPVVPKILAWDKLQHALAYAILMLLSGRFLVCVWQKPLKGWLTGLAFTMLFGLLIEIGQGSLSTNRHADWWDMAANAVGAGLVLLIALTKKKSRT